MKAGSVTAANAMWCLPDVSQDAREETALSTARELDRFLQMYAVEKAKLEARRQGHSVTEQSLADGSVKLTINVGGAA